MTHSNFSTLAFFIIFVQSTSGSTDWLQSSCFLNIPKCAIFGIFSEFLSTQNVNVARSARNVDFFLWFLVILLTVNFWGCFLFIPGSPGGNSSWHILCNASFIVIHSWSRGRIRWHGRRGWGRSHIWGSIGSFGIPYFVQQLQTQPHIEVTGEDEALIEHPLGTGPFARVFCQAYFDEAAMKENKT